MSKVFIYDSAKKLLVQKPEMEKPVDMGLVMNRQAFNVAVQRYEEHIKTLLNYPCSFLPDEADGNEFIEGKDFELRHGYYNDRNEPILALDWDGQIAVPIQQEQEKPKGLVFGNNYKFVSTDNPDGPYTPPKLKKTPDSVILTRKELSELISSAIGYGYGVGMDNPSESEYFNSKQQYINSIIK